MVEGPTAPLPQDVTVAMEATASARRASRPARPGAKRITKGFPVFFIRGPVLRAFPNHTQMQGFGDEARLLLLYPYLLQCSEGFAKMDRFRPIPACPLRFSGHWGCDGQKPRRTPRRQPAAGATSPNTPPVTRGRSE